LIRIEDGTLPFGTLEVASLANGGVGIAKNEYYYANTPEDVVEYIDKLEEDIISGKVTVTSFFDFETYEEFAAWRDQ